MRPFAMIIALLTVAGAADAETLDTPTYRITVTVNCPEGNVTCEEVQGVIVNKATGTYTALNGTTKHTVGADGVTPSRFLGYVFKKGRMSLFASTDGYFCVTRECLWLQLLQRTPESRCLAGEMGTWRQ